MCSRSIAILPISGITNFFTSQRQASTVRGLHRTWTCSTRYRSATVGLDAGLFRRDDTVAAERDALRLSARPRLNDIDLGPGGIHADAEPLQLAVPIDGVLVAHRQGVDGAMRDGPVFEPSHVIPIPVCG